MSKLDGLTAQEKQLLERYHDGALGSDEELGRAERLMASTSLARVYLASLEEIKLGVRGAERAWWESASEQVPGAGSLLERASREELAGRALEELVPLLERYHDGAVIEAEAVEVEALMEAREDVAGYLLGLSELGLGVKGATREAIDAVDFGGLWEGIASRLDEEDRAAGGGTDNVLSFEPGKKKSSGEEKETRERPAFSEEDHRVLLYRYHDQEVSEAERAQVEAWAEIDPGVSATLGALEELRLAASASMELAEEHIEPGLMWSLLEERIQEESVAGSDQQVAAVASLSAHRARKAEQVERAQSVGSTRRREVFIALAAMFCTVLGVAIFKDSLFPGEKVIVEKTVVIVDSLEYGDGTSVMVTGPMQSASMEVGVEEGVESEGAEAPGEGLEQGEAPTPTVIWLIDPDEPAEQDEAPSSKEEVERDAGHLGQPI